VPLPPDAKSTAETQLPDEFLVICLCAEWCGVCRDYKPAFLTLTTQFPDTRFCWFDIEERADDLGELDIENFPMIIIRRHRWVLFYGAIQPRLSHLKKLIGTFKQQTFDESQNYAHSNPERRSWQENQELYRLGMITELSPRQSFT